MADEMVKQGIVEQISERHVGRLLAEAELKPHQSRYWLHPPLDTEFAAKVTDICQLYEQAAEQTYFCLRVLVPIGDGRVDGSQIRRFSGISPH